MILIKKAIRSMLRNKKSYISCILLMAMSVSFYISFNVAITNLISATDSYYENNRLADVFVKVNSIGDSDISEVEQISGVSEAMPRIVYDFRLMSEKIENLATVRLISDDLDYEGTQINQYVYEGNDISDDNDILLNIEFMTLNELEIGDSVEVAYGGNVEDFEIVGSVMSPEYVYLMKDAKELMPDKSTFGFGYISQDRMKSLMNMPSSYNELVIDLDNKTNYEDIKIQLDDELAKFGLTSMIPREDQSSYSMLETEIQGVSSMATAIPFFFMSIVMVILYLTLKRVIEQERMEIGMLKAFGYTNNEILRHYLVYGVITGVIGGFLGCIMGSQMANELFMVYLDYFLLPVKNAEINYLLFVYGFLLAIVTGVLSTYFGVRKILSLSPVESMKSDPPIVNVKKSFKDNKFLKLIFRASGFMALRNINRNRLRSVFIVLGVGFSFSMAAYMLSVTSLMDGMMLVQIDDVKKYDAKFSFNTPVGENSLQYVNDYDGVTLAEGIYEMPVTLRSGTKTTGSVLLGLNEGSQLYKIYDEHLKSNLKLSDDGIVLSSYFADQLGVQKGEYIYIDSPYLEDSVKVKITDVNRLTMADSTYININDLYDMFNISGYTSVIFNTDNYDVIKEDFKYAANISVIEDKETTKNNLEEMLGSYDIMFDFMNIMTVGMVFIIIYNISVISFSERSREYATLKVIGFSTKEISEIVDLEFWLLTFVGLILGVYFTYLLKVSINMFMVVDNLSFDTRITLYEVVGATFQCCLAVYLSNLMNKKNIKKLDLVTVLKERV
ncbi:MAG: ABC transporter permease [Lachnospirales bacterium]